MNRRKFIKQSSIVSLGFLTLSRCMQRSAIGSEEVLALVKDPNGYLDLPEGFSYKVISRLGDPMKDGLLVPGRPDGMGTFLREDGKVIIIRNHENSVEPEINSAFGKQGAMLNSVEPNQVYDFGKGEYPGLGGTTTMIYDEEKNEVVEEFMSLAGTYRNCAGGVTPWNSWLTCEEDVSTQSNGDHIEKEHGYVFEIPASATGLVDPKPIKDMGRFNHEAVTVDPETSIVYQTEDRGDGLIYRFIPNDKNNLHEGGKLQVLAVKDQPSLDTRNWEEKLVQVGQKLEVQWMDIDDVTSPEDDLRYRGFDMGAARFARGEGMWLGNGEVFFACTNGGPNKFGQVFRYDLAANTVELYLESEDKSLLHMCDNLTISPLGMMVLCEDNSKLNHMRYLSKDGELKTLAVNKSSKSELTGSVFSPSGKTLFVNVQENGETLAITGPWEQLWS